MVSKSSTHSPAHAAATTDLILPVSIVTPTDIGKLVRELENLDNVLMQLHVRNPGTPVSLPTISSPMQSVVEVNKVNLLQAPDREKLQSFLTDLREKAPRLHISFSSEPSRTFLDKLTVWLRREIHPYVLLTIGLQPAIGAGCIVRSNNKVFDLSLRQTFIDKRHLLLAQVIPPAAEAPAS